MIRAHQIDRRELDVFTNQMLEDDCENTFDEPVKERLGEWSTFMSEFYDGDTSAYSLAC
ncbi:MAG: hypothetical protein O3B86_02400 [Planctomycetota bacterium]|nr:hypothetical protein [Planctomycetota bacterium]